MLPNRAKAPVHFRNSALDRKVVREMPVQIEPEIAKRFHNRDVRGVQQDDGRGVAGRTVVTSGGEEDDDGFRIRAVLSDVHLERPATKVPAKSCDSGFEVRTRAESECTPSSA